MKALVLDWRRRAGAPRHRRRSRAEIGRPGEVLVRVHAAALNRLDLFVADGLPGVTYAFPHVVGSDGPGVVEQVGRACSRRARATGS